MKIRTLLHSTLFTGTLILTITGIVSRFIGFYYKIFLARTIGADGLGLYQLIFPVFALFLSICAAGIHTAISKCCAASTSDEEARSYLYTGLAISLCLSLVCTGCILKFSSAIGQLFSGDRNIAELLTIMAISLTFASIHSCINGYYYGRKKTMIPAISQLLEQIVRVLAVYLILRYLEQCQSAVTARTAVWGLTIGEAAGAVYALIAVGLTRHKEKRKGRRSRRNYLLLAKNLMVLAVPLTMNRIFTSLLQNAENLLIPMKLSAFGYSGTDALAIYGILTGMVFSCVMFPAVLSNSFSVLLLPTIAKACAKKDQRLIDSAVRKTVEGCVILGLLCTFGFLLCGDWIGIHLFHNTLAGSFLKTVSWICPFLFLGGTLSSILHGLGKPQATLYLNLIASGIRILFIFFGIPVYGIRAYLWGMLVSQIFSASGSYLFIRRYTCQNPTFSRGDNPQLKV